MYTVCWMLRTSDWIQNSVEKLCCTCWYAKLSKTVWIIHCFCLVKYYVIINLFLDQCYFLCHITSYIGWEIKFAFKWNLNFMLLQVIIIRGSLRKSLMVVLPQCMIIIIARLTKLLWLFWLSHLVLFSLVPWGYRLWKQVWLSFSMILSVVKVCFYCL